MWNGSRSALKRVAISSVRTTLLPSRTGISLSRTHRSRRLAIATSVSPADYRPRTCDCRSIRSVRGCCAVCATCVLCLHNLGSPPYVRYRSNSALSFAVDCNAFRYSEKDSGSILSSTYRPVKWMILRLLQNCPFHWMILQSG